jgi:predicted transcriptional regulator/prophage maintenance system killer protein
MNPLENKILSIFNKNINLSSSDIYEKLDKKSISLVTVKRTLTSLFVKKYLERIGAGRSVTYRINTKGLLLKHFDLREYLDLPEDARGVESFFNFDLFASLDVDVFEDAEVNLLKDSTKIFVKNKIEGSDTIHKKELERFIIELSWKSSKIEGNTYTLLDTEMLLKEGLKSNKNTESETRMILNHKKAFDYIFFNKESFKEISVKKIEEIHYLLTEDLGIKRNIRKSPVGVTGTIYKPLDNEFQVREALESMVVIINKISEPYKKALLIILCISYVQPFEDGNKRTSRLIGNAILLANGLAPLSYRNVDEVEYRVASIVFYEQNSLEAFKKIFVEQYIFSCKTYNLG